MMALEYDLHLVEFQYLLLRAWHLSDNPRLEENLISSRPA